MPKAQRKLAGHTIVNPLLNFWLAWASQSIKMALKLGHVSEEHTTEIDRKATSARV